MALRRSAKFLIEALVGVIAGCAIVAGVAFWMLARGPVAVNFLTPHVEQAFQNDEGVHVEVGETHVVWDGWGESLSLSAKNWTVFDKDNQELAHFPAVGVQVSIPALFRGLVAPTDIAVTGVQLSLHRTQEGAFGFGRLPNFELGPPDARDGVDVSDFAPGVLDAVMAAPSPDDPLSYLREITISEARITLYDQREGLEWDAPGARLTIARNAAGLTARGELPLDLHGEEVGRVEGDLLFDRAEETLEVQVGFDDLALASAANYLPDATSLMQSDLILSGQLNSTLHINGRLEDLVFAVSSGPGRVPAPEGFSQPLDIESAAIEGRYGLESGLLAIERAQFDLRRANGAPGLSLGMTANIQFADEGVGLSAKLVAAEVTREEILALWPTTAEGGGRPWIEENLIDGRIEAAELEIEAAAPARDFAALEVRKLDGGFTFEETELFYLKPLPPVTNASGTGAITLDEIVFFVEEGQVGDLQGREAIIELYDLESDQHKARVTVPLSGPLEDAMALLNHPRLRLVDELGLDAAGVTGQGDVQLEIAFPLIDSISFADVDIGGVGRLSQVGVANFMGEQDIAGGDFAIKLTKDGMTLKGPVDFAGVPVSANWSEVFDAGESYGRQIEVVAEVLTDADRALFGLDAAPYLSGPVSAQIVMQQRADGSGLMRVISDLSDAEIRIDEIAYLKRPGAGAQAAATVHYDSLGVSDIREIKVTAPDLQLAGNAKLTETRDGLRILELTSLRWGASDLRNIYYTEEEGTPFLSVEGGVLDASLWLEEDETDEEEAAQETADEPQDYDPLILRAERLDQLLLGEGRRLENVSLEIHRVENGYETIELRARLPAALSRTEGDDGETGPSALSLSFGPQVDTNGRATHGLDLSADDMGAALRVFDVVDSIEGGVVRIRGGMDGPLLSGPLSASIDARDYALVQAPALAKVLTVATLTGIGQALDGPGLSFNRLVGDFIYDNDMISTDLIRAYGPGLGITAKGDFDLEGDETDAGGTLVPAYALNQVLGAIPVLGPLLTGGEGGGLIGVVYRVEGDLDDPQVSVNPLSALAPGFLRGLFELDVGDEQEANRFAPSLYPEGVDGVR